MQSEFHLPKATDPRRLRVAAVVALVVAGGVVVAGTIGRAADNSEAKQWSNAVSIPTVHLIDGKPAAATNGLILPGTMQAWNTAKIYAQVNGYVKAWYKDIGNPVTGGTALGLIQTPELDQQIIQARADLAKAKADASLAQSTADRWGKMLTTLSVSKQEADEKNGDLADKKAGVQAAEANMNRLLAMKAFSTLRAPFAGTVTLRSADIGDYVGPNADNHQPLFAIDDARKIRVYVSVPQAYSTAVRSGSSVTLSVPDYPDRRFTAHLAGDAGAVDPQTGAFQVQLVVDNADRALRPGGYAQVKFDMPPEAGTVVIPSSTLVFRAAGTQVATVDAGDHIQMRSIKIGRDLGNTVEVISGLQRNVRIVDNPPDSIAPGELVRVRENGNG